MNTQYLDHLPDDWHSIAKVFTALGDGTRQKLLLLFEPGEEISLKTFVALLPLSRTAVVHHISTLEQAGLLTPHKRGREVFYTLNAAPAVQALEQVRQYALDMQAAQQSTSCK